jgi:hypothetical protein
LGKATGFQSPDAQGVSGAILANFACVLNPVQVAVPLFKKWRRKSLKMARNGLSQSAHLEKP